MTGSPIIFGRYEIVRPLAAGGMGEVLLARQAGLPGVERLIVLKKILPHFARDSGFLDRFLDETRVAASLTHGNIVQVYEVGEVDGQYFMAMEYVDGMDLKEALARLRSEGRRMPEDVALYILVEVAKALAYAHQKTGPDGVPLGIVHRDVSPANLLLSRDGQVKLADFGVAKATARLALSLPGTLHGKVYYMAPEQVSGLDVDARSDVFSLGVVAYEILAGSRPFEGDSDVAVIERVRACSPVPLHDAAPWVPPSLAAIVGRALSRDPRHRHPDMETFQQSLTSYMLEAHTLVSARALADFMTGMAVQSPSTFSPVTPKPDFPSPLPGNGLPGTPEPTGRDSAFRTRTVAAANATTPAPIKEPRARHSVLRWLGPLLGLLIGAAGASMYLVDHWSPGPVEAGTAPVEAVTVPVDASSLEVASDIDAIADTGPLDESPETPDEAANIEPAPAEEASVPTAVQRQGPSRPAPPQGKAGTTEVVPPGRVMFRFFPADCDVFLNDRPLHPPGNLVDMELPPGRYVLRIQSPTGSRRRVETFDVVSGGTRALGTLELAVESEGIEEAP